MCRSFLSSCFFFFLFGQKPYGPERYHTATAMYVRMIDAVASGLMSRLAQLKIIARDIYFQSTTIYHPFTPLVTKIA